MNGAFQRDGFHRITGRSIVGWSMMALALSLSGTLVVRAADESPKPAPTESADSPKEDSKAESEVVAKEEPEEKEEELVEFTPWKGGNIDFTGWVDFSVGGTTVKGNPAAFQRRNDIHDGPFGGISAFGWEKFVGEEGILHMEGKAIGGNDDYDLSIRYTIPDKAYVRAGASRHRTWYDGAGGFNFATGAWYPLGDQELALDRDSFWIEAGLTNPESLELSVRYERQERQGQKDSTIWGTTAAGVGGRGIAASFRGIDETRDLFSLNARHTFDKSTAGLGLNFEHYEANNSLNFRRDVGGLTQTFTTQRDRVESDLLSVHGFTEVRFNDQVSYSTAYSFTTIDTDLNGSRIVGAGFDAVFDPTLARFPGYTGLFGGTRLNQHVASVNLVYLPLPTLSLVPSFRVESTGADGDTYFTSTPVGATSAQNVSSQNDFLDLSERLELRYSGVTNWVFYTRGDWDQGDGDLKERQTALATGAVLLNRSTDFNRFTQKYTTGINWYPRRRLNMAAQYYFKRRSNDYSHPVDSTGNAGALRYPAYLTQQDFNTHDLNYRITWRPTGSLVLVSRYDYQTSTVDTGGAGAPAIQSADMDSHIFSQSLSWAPLTRLYLQGNFSYVIDTLQTPASQPNGIVPDSENNYWNAGINAGYVLDQRTDLEADYQYYRADNFVNNSAVSQPYGSGFREHRVSATLTRRIRENLRVTFGYGYFFSSDETYGGLEYYRAHLLSTTLQCRF